VVRAIVEPCTLAMLCTYVADTLAWEPVNIEEAQPKPRAGHCAAAVGSRMYVWSGRDGYKKAWNSQVMWDACSHSVCRL
jgi:host cell factor